MLKITQDNNRFKFHEQYNMYSFQKHAKKKRKLKWHVMEFFFQNARIVEWHTSDEGFRRTCAHIQGTMKNVMK